MKIAIFTDSYAPQVSGVATRYATLVDELAKIGHLVDVYAPYYGNVPPKQNVSVHTYKGKDLFISKNIKWVGRIWHKKIEEEFANRTRPTIVHIATEGPLGHLGKRLAKKYNIPYTMGAHTDYVFYLPKYHIPPIFGPLVGLYLRWFYSGAKVVLAPSAFYAHKIRSYGVRNVSVWSLGLDSTIWSGAARSDEWREKYKHPDATADDAVIFLYAGRLAPEKNLDWIIDNWIKHHLYKTSSLVFVGCGPEEEKIRSLQLPGVHVVGELHGDDLRTAYASSDVFVFPSESETFGNAVLEAGFSELLILTSKRGAAPLVFSSAIGAHTKHDFGLLMSYVAEMNVDEIREYKLETRREALHSYAKDSFVQHFLTAVGIHE